MNGKIKQLSIVSGKGGTGKTSISASFAKLSQKRVLVDCDVDAANLHIVMHPEIIEEIPFVSQKKAVISQDRCRGCGDCVVYCRFHAIKDFYVVDPLLCEGCAVCAMMCPYGAIDMVDHVSGNIAIARADSQPFLFARMGIAESNSGKLVDELRQRAVNIAQAEGYNLIIIDGPPGIGCPVIASITGTTHVLIVTEPTLSGMHDLERIIEVTQHFKIPASVCINKYNISESNTQAIHSLCDAHGVEVIGTIPLDTDFVKAQIAGKTIVEFSNGKASKAIQSLWTKIENKLI